MVYQGEITKRSMMFLSLTFDHRVIDGAQRQPFCTHSRATWKTLVDGGGCSLRANLRPF